MNEKQNKISNSNVKRQGYNWLNTITISIVKSLTLSLVCIFTIGFTLLITTLRIDWYNYYIISVSVNGIAFILFLASTEIYVSAKSYDLSKISKDQYVSLNSESERTNIDWDNLKSSQFIICKKKVKQARIIYKIGLLLLFIGLFFIFPFFEFNYIILLAGIGLILWLTIK